LNCQRDLPFGNPNIIMILYTTLMAASHSLPNSNKLLIHSFDGVHTSSTIPAGIIRNRFRRRLFQCQL
jgi:hypothetical protein